MSNQLTATCNGGVTEMCLPASSSTSTSTSTSTSNKRAHIGSLWVEERETREGNSRWYVGGYIGKKRYANFKPDRKAAIEYARTQIDNAEQLGSDFARMTSATRIELLSAWNRARSGNFGLLDAILFYEQNRDKRFAENGEAAIASPVATVTIQKAHREYVDQCNFRKLSVKKLSLVSASVGRLRDDFGDSTKLTAFTGEVLTKWLGSLTNKFTGEPLASGTINTTRKELNAFFSFTVKRDWINENPVAKVERVDQDEMDREIMSIELAESLMEVVATRYPHLAGFYALALFAGIRPSEVERMNWREHVHLDAGTPMVILPASIAKKTKNRRVFLLEYAPNLEAWLRFAKKHARNGNITERNERLQQTDKVTAAKAIYTAAGFKRWPQDVMRHSFVSYHIEAFGDRARSAELAGHDVATQKKHYESKLTPVDDPKAPSELVQPKYAKRFFEIMPVEYCEQL